MNEAAPTGAINESACKFTYDTLSRNLADNLPLSSQQRVLLRTLITYAPNYVLDDAFIRTINRI